MKVMISIYGVGHLILSYFVWWAVAGRLFAYVYVHIVYIDVHGDDIYSCFCADIQRSECLY